MSRGCLRSIQDYSQKHFLEVNISGDVLSKLEENLPGGGSRWFISNGNRVYWFPQSLTPKDVERIDKLLEDLGAESWEYGEYKNNFPSRKH
jgi:hypothetical protein